MSEAAELSSLVRGAPRDRPAQLTGGPAAPTVRTRRVLGDFASLNVGDDHLPVVADIVVSGRRRRWAQCAQRMGGRASDDEACVGRREGLLEAEPVIPR